MKDSFGREIDYLRVSITDRCNLRCIYCMPESGVEEILSHEDILSYEEIVRVCAAFAELGLKKVKITGGEPLVRKNAAGLVARIKSLSGIEQVTMTTNGVLLRQNVKELKAAGLDGVNISLDTLDPAVFRRITRFGNLAGVLDGLDAAVEAGIPSIKINCVPIAGINCGGAADLAALARERDIKVRFIEMMPVGLGANFRYVGGMEIRRMLEEAYGEMTPYVGKLGNGPSVYYTIPGFRGQIGFISAVTSCFCERCNRVRLTANGFLKTCLNFDVGTNLLPALREGDEALLQEAIRLTVLSKPQKHAFFRNDGTLRAETKIMSQIGG